MSVVKFNDEDTEDTVAFRIEDVEVFSVKGGKCKFFLKGRVLPVEVTVSKEQSRELYKLWAGVYPEIGKEYK